MLDTRKVLEGLSMERALGALGMGMRFEALDVQAIIKTLDAETLHKSARKVGLGAAAAGAVVVAAGWIRRWQWSSRRGATAGRAAPLPADADVLRVGFSAKKLPQEIDHIVIGSGLAGLYLAALLSKVGRRVLVLEQHYVAGGCTHTFTDKGFEFDTGVHYVGVPTQFTTLLDFVAGRDGSVVMHRHGTEDGSQVYVDFNLNGNDMHKFRPGPKTFVNDLVAKFPEEQRAIRRFFRGVAPVPLGMKLVILKQFIPRLVWKALISVPSPARWLLNRYVARTLTQGLDEAGIKDPRLRAIIMAERGDHGMMNPDTCPHFLHAWVLGHFIAQGGFFPAGGSDKLAMACVPTIIEAGGAVLVRAPVARIVVENGRAVGVEVAGKPGVIRARRSVISAAGAQVTYRKLLDKAVVEKAGGAPRSLLASEQSGGISHHTYAFFGLEGSSEENRLPSWNVISFLSPEKTATGKQINSFFGFPSAKDPDYERRCPGKSVALLLTQAPLEVFKSVAGAVNKRGEDYAQLKQKYKDLFLEVLYRNFPHLEGKIVYSDVATPVTNEHYLGRAASYGLDQDGSRFLDPSLRAAVPGISGLYLTGQDIFVCGVWSQPVAAWMTFGKVLGLTSLDFWLLFSDFAWKLGKRLLFDKTYAPMHP